MLGQAGYLDLALEESDGPLAASLVTEWCAEAAVVYPIGVRTMVLPHLFAADDSMPTTAAVYSAGSSPLVRYALGAESLVVLDGDRACGATQGPMAATSVASRYGYPVARIEIRDWVEAVTTPGGEVIRLWWLLANVAEIIGQRSGSRPDDQVHGREGPVRKADLGLPSAPAPDCALRKQA